MNVIEIQQLVKGSQNLDRMKREIKIVVKTLTGIICQLPSTTLIEDNLSCGRCVWIIHRGIGPPYNKVEIRCRVTTETSKLLVYSTEDVNVPFPMEYVREVHLSLGAFVLGTEGLYPDLSSKLEPVLKAAEVFP